MADKFALIIPALNEEATIGSTLRALIGRGLSQIIVADNGSTDRTAEIARANGAQVVTEPQRGYGNACLAAMAALRPEITIVVFMDGDGSDDPDDLPRLVAPIANGQADLVLGSRVLGSREPGALSLQQELGNRVATWMLHRLFGARCTDLGPFRAIRRDALQALGMRDPNYGWTVEMQIKAHQKGLRVREVAVNYRRRRGGESKVSRTIRGSLFAGTKIVWTILRHRYGG